MDIQIVIVVLIVVAAVVYVARSIYRSAKGHACETGNCGCDSKEGKLIK
jgi:FeoB-associated Cys-rich membrane protein